MRALHQLVRIFLDWLDLDHQLRIALVGAVLPQSFRLDHHAHVLPLRRGRDGLHRRAEVRDVQAATQHFRQAGLQEIHHDSLSLLAHIDRNLVAGQINDDAAFATRTTAEVDIPQVLLAARRNLGRRSYRYASSIYRRRDSAGAVDRNHHCVALDSGCIIERTLQVEHQTGTFPCLHHIYATHIPKADILRRLAGRIGSCRKIERNARRTGDRKTDRRLADRILHHHLDDDVRSLLIRTDRLDGVFLCLSEAANQREAHHGILLQCLARGGAQAFIVFFNRHHFVFSCNSNLALRSIQSPAASRTISFSSTSASVIRVTMPKFWPI